MREVVCSVLLLTFLGLISGCGGSEQDPRERQAREHYEGVKTHLLQAYRAEADGNYAAAATAYRTVLEHFDALQQLMHKKYTARLAELWSTEAMADYKWKTRRLLEPDADGRLVSVKRHIEQLRRHQEQQARGMVRYQGQWMSPAEKQKRFEAAQRAKGLVKHDERWVTQQAKKQLDQGKVRYAGQWMSPSEKTFRAKLDKGDWRLATRLPAPANDDAHPAAQFNRALIEGRPIVLVVNAKGAR